MGTATLKRRPLHGLASANALARMLDMSAFNSFATQTVSAQEVAQLFTEFEPLRDSIMEQVHRLLQYQQPIQIGAWQVIQRFQHTVESIRKLLYALNDSLDLRASPNEVALWTRLKKGEVIVDPKYLPHQLIAVLKRAKLGDKELKSDPTSFSRASLAVLLSLWHRGTTHRNGTI